MHEKFISFLCAFEKQWRSFSSSIYFSYRDVVDVISFAFFLGKFLNPGQSNIEFNLLRYWFYKRKVYMVRKFAVFSITTKTIRIEIVLLKLLPTSYSTYCIRIEIISTNLSKIFHIDSSTGGHLLHHVQYCPETLIFVLTVIQLKYSDTECMY